MVAITPAQVPELPAVTPVLVVPVEFDVGPVISAPVRSVVVASDVLSWSVIAYEFVGLENVVPLVTRWEKAATHNSFAAVVVLVVPVLNVVPDELLIAVRSKRQLPLVQVYSSPTATMAAVAAVEIVMDDEAPENTRPTERNAYVPLVPNEGTIIHSIPVAVIVIAEDEATATTTTLPSVGVTPIVKVSDELVLAPVLFFALDDETADHEAEHKREVKSRMISAFIVFRRDRISRRQL